MPSKKNKDLDEIKKLYKKTTLYIVRCDKKDKLQDSAPCNKCLLTIIELDIKRIVFSSVNNTFISCNPKELTINHISSGNRHLTKKQEDDTNIKRKVNKSFK
tara:strand:- start:242 stop:547 length:306 start_codon:yes stop_codon:yes gene_type:complete